MSQQTNQKTAEVGQARLALADGSLFRGQGFGAMGQGIVAKAEIVFNTAMSGYQESLTDPSYCGQILVETFPLIGNTGINPIDLESERVQVTGFVVRELARRHSNFRATGDLAGWLASQRVLGIEGVDTRAITRHIRSSGAMGAALTDDTSISDAALVEMARSVPSMAGQNLAAQVGSTTIKDWPVQDDGWMPMQSPVEQAVRVLAFDCGAKRNILRNLTSRGVQVQLIPFDTPAQTILQAFDAGACDGLFVSNGPGDPQAVDVTIQTLRTIVESDREIPIFGICLGHQLLALACGAKTYKLPFGHRGINQPVVQCATGRVAMTSQNHGFAVDKASLEQAGGIVTHEHLNDQTVAGFALTDKPVFAVQYHPEASPGPHDAAALFDAFVAKLKQAHNRKSWS